MEYWLVATLQRIEQQMADVKTQTGNTYHLLQRLAILATLWAGVATLGYNSRAAQELLTASIKAALRLP